MKIRRAVDCFGDSAERFGGDYELADYPNEQRISGLETGGDSFGDPQEPLIAGNEGGRT